MKRTTICEQWSLELPDHRAERPEWPTWERPRLESMSRNIRPGDVVYDVGAEEGDLSGLYASWGARLVLLEPNPRVWPNIRAIWEANRFPRPLGWFVGFAGMANRLRPERDNVGDLARDRDGWPACAYGPLIGDHGFRHLAEEADATPQIRLDRLAVEIDARPDVLTFDVEGAELQALRGAMALLQFIRPLVFVSIHPPFMADLYKAEPQDVHDYMAALGYQAEHLATDHEEHWAFWHPAGRALL